MNSKRKAISFMHFIYVSAKNEFAHVFDLYLSVIVAIVYPSKKTFARVKDKTQALNTLEVINR